MGCRHWGAGLLRTTSFCRWCVGSRLWLADSAWIEVDVHEWVGDGVVWLRLNHYSFFCLSFLVYICQGSAGTWEVLNLNFLVYRFDGSLFVLFCSSLLLLFSLFSSSIFCSLKLLKCSSLDFFFRFVGDDWYRLFQLIGLLFVYLFLCLLYSYLLFLVLSLLFFTYLLLYLSLHTYCYLHRR